MKDETISSKHKLVKAIVKGAVRRTPLPFTAQIKATPEVSYKESRTVSPIPKWKPDRPAVAPGLEYSGFNKTTTKQY